MTIVQFVTDIYLVNKLPLSYRTVSREQFVSSTSPSGLNTACQPAAKHSLSSLDKYIRRRNSLVMKVQSQYIAGLYVAVDWRFQPVLNDALHPILRGLPVLGMCCDPSCYQGVYLHGQGLIFQGQGQDFLQGQRHKIISRPTLRTGRNPQCNY